jgi:hypothetical protein
VAIPKAYYAPSAVRADRLSLCWVLRVRVLASHGPRSQKRQNSIAEAYKSVDGFESSVGSFGFILRGDVSKDRGVAAEVAVVEAEAASRRLSSWG